eukprot:TRINITY_DN49333_c0_g1_i2.p1 TRINITY_DN49333_c0_g1~~TRINITY_DN49333_c0_g1_i2.p1  ORF type:complete len:589 (-),score=141.85 TRINITY_DN49333_c0_g1_i2:150-1916(-)
MPTTATAPTDETGKQLDGRGDDCVQKGKRQSSGEALDDRDVRRRTEAGPLKETEDMLQQEEEAQAPARRGSLLKFPTLSIAPGSEEPDLHKFKFQGTKECEVRVINSEGDFRRLFQEETRKADESRERWMRDPSAKWIRQMWSELTVEQRARLRSIHRQTIADGRPEEYHSEAGSAEDIMSRWGYRAEFASRIVDWWVRDRDLEAVLERARALGHTAEGPDVEKENALVGGYILEGDFVEKHIAAGAAAKKPVSVKETSCMVDTMTPGLMGRQKVVSLYTVMAENCFDMEESVEMSFTTAEDLEAKLEKRVAIPRIRRMGSLNTTYTYGPTRRSGVGLLDKFVDTVGAAAGDPADEIPPRALGGKGKGDDAVAYLNRRAYIIWKFPGYCTAYHQDTHVPPHFTIYNQVSGASVFHFMPLLVGVYLQQLGRLQGPKALLQALRRLDEAGIGSTATIGPGQVAMITPFASHGVWVPEPRGEEFAAANDDLEPFQVSLIRAVEFFVAPILEDVHHDLIAKRGASETWHVVLPPTDEEVAMHLRFEKAQDQVRKHLGNISRREWCYFAELLRKEWRYANKDEETSSDDAPGQ